MKIINMTTKDVVLKVKSAGWGGDVISRHEYEKKIYYNPLNIGEATKDGEIETRTAEIDKSTFPTETEGTQFIVDYSLAEVLLGIDEKRKDLVVVNEDSSGFYNVTPSGKKAFTGDQGEYYGTRRYQGD